MSKIIIHQGQGANNFIRMSWAHAFNAVGHTVVYWSDQVRSPYDIFYEHKDAQIFIGATYQLNNAIVKNLIARPDMKVLLYASQWGSDDDQIDKQKYPLLFATEEEKKLVERVVKGCPNFKYVVDKYPQNQMEQTHDHWKELGLISREVLVCANLTNYFLTKPSADPKYAAQLVFAGGLWAYKNKYLSWLQNLCYPNTLLNVRIFGGGWSTPSAVGVASEETLRNSYASSTICPNLFEPHAIELLSDLNQRLFEVPACGGFQLTQNAIGVRDLFSEDELVTFDDQKDFYEKVNHFLLHPEERLPFIERSAKRVYSQHTNYHRAIALSEMLDLPTEVLKERCQLSQTTCEKFFDELENQKSARS